VTHPRATASRAVGALEVTSTIRAFPLLSTCESRLAIGPPVVNPDHPGGA
jgi:hypothetical protein